MRLMSVRLWCSDIERSRAFYDAVFAALGGPASSTPAGYPILRYRPENGPVLILGKALDGEPVSAANGGTILFEAPDEDAVRAWHAAGLANGGRSAGDPEPKPQTGGKFGAYLRDPDGNKLGAYFGLSL